MASKFGSNIIDVLKWSVKLLVTLRYGYDTFTVAVAGGSSPVVAGLDVLVIDAFLLLMWVLTSYNGKREDILKMRLPSAIGAWTMYLAMLWIAGAVGEPVTLIARVTGGLALAWDSYAVIQSGLSGWLERRREAKVESERRSRLETLDQRRHRVRESAWKTVYSVVVRTVGLVLIGFRSLGRVASDVAEDEELMDFHVSQARAIRRGQAGMSVVPIASADPNEMIEVWQDSEGWHWTCRACSETSTHAFKGEGNARGASRHHTRKLDIPGHQVFAKATQVIEVGIPAEPNELPLSS